VEIVGFVCDSEGRKPVSDKVEAICKSLYLRTTKDVRAFLGMCAFYRI